MNEDFGFDVFLSHSSKDKAVVRPLAERLRADGLKVWFDEWVLKPGDSIPAKIEEGLERSRVLVLCMSANAFGSDWAQLESGTFRFRDPLNKERRFLPLRLDDAPIKGSLAQFLYINWLPADREQEYARVLELCRRRKKSSKTQKPALASETPRRKPTGTGESDKDKQRAAERRWQYIQNHPICSVEVVFILKGAVGFDWFCELLEDTRLNFSRDEKSFALGQLLAISDKPNTKERSRTMEKPICSFWEIYEPEKGYWFKKIAPDKRTFSTVAGFDAAVPWSVLGVKRVEKLQDIAVLSDVGVSIPARAYQVGVEEFALRFVGETFSFSVELSEHGLSFLHEMASTQHVVVKEAKPAPIGSMFSGVQLLEIFYRQLLPRPKNEKPKREFGFGGLSGPGGAAISFFPVMPKGFMKTEESKEYTFTITVPGKVDTESRIKELEEKLKANPADAKSYAELAAVYSHLGRLQDAMHWLEIGIEKAPADPDVHGMKAEILSKMGRFDEALALYRKAEKLCPQNDPRIRSAVQNGLGICLSELDKDDEALCHFQAAASIEPSKASYQSNLSMALAAVKRYSDALVPAERAVELVPDDHRSAVHLGILLTIVDRTADAIPHFEKATQLSPKSAEAHEFLGESLRKVNQHEKAVMCLQRAVEIEETARRYDLLAASLAALDRWPEAEAAFRRVAELEPNKSQALANIGATLANQQKLQEALQFFEQAASADPDNADARLKVNKLREFLSGTD